MALGITNSTVVTLKNITDIANSTSYPELLIKINHTVYNGFFYFIILWILVIILYMAANQFKDQPLVNAMFATSTVALIAMFMRVITITTGSGDILGLVTDFQMWSFFIIAALLAGVNWAIKR